MASVSARGSSPRHGERSLRTGAVWVLCATSENWRAALGTGMLEIIIVRCTRACCCFPWLVIITAMIGAAGAVAYVRQNFAIDTNTSQLISSALPWRQRELQLDAAFPHRADAIVVVVDSLTPEIADSSTRALAAALATRTDLFRAVR